MTLIIEHRISLPALDSLLLGSIQDQLALVAKTQKAIIMTTAEAVAAIGKVEITLGKISAEQTKIVTDLRTALEAAGNVDPKVAAGLNRLGTLSTAIDDVIPDDVKPEDPAPVITEPAA